MKLNEHSFICKVNEIRGEVLYSILNNPPKINEIKNLKNSDLKLNKLIEFAIFQFQKKMKEKLPYKKYFKTEDPVSKYLYTTVFEDSDSFFLSENCLEKFQGLIKKVYT